MMNELLLESLRQDNYAVSWLLERYDIHINELHFERKEDLGERELGFLLNLMKAYDRPDKFEPSLFSDSPIPLILEYLRRTHRFYLDKKLLEIEININKWCEKETHLLSEGFNIFFVQYRNKLERHIKQEEEVLFPYIEALLAQREKKSRPEDLVQTKISLIRFLLDHDHEIEEELTNFTEILLKYQPLFEAVYRIALFYIR